MGNITSGQGNNFKSITNDDGSVTEIKTPLNLFIDKVFNDDYFFSPNLSDDMIYKVNQYRNRNENGDKNVNNENEYVLLKRAACTANTHIPIVLPSVDCLYDDEGKEIPGSCKNNWEKAPRSIGNGYTVKIQVRDHTGKPLSDYQKLTTPQQVIDNLDKLEILVNKGEQPTDPKLIPLYNYLKQIQEMNILSKDNEYYAEVAESDKGGSSVIVGSKLCTNFYAGTNLGENGINYKNVNLSQKEIKQKKPLEREYNSMDMAGNSISGAFCGKVYQYEEITGKGGIKQYLTKLMKKNKQGVGNEYLIDNFPDCACLNSIGARLREQMNKSKQQTRLLLEEKGLPNQLDKDNLIAQEIAQNNDMYCRNNLLNTSQQHQSAYIMDNNLLKDPVKICSNFSITQDIEIEEGAEFKADASCGPDNLKDELQEKVNACLLDKSKCTEDELEQLEKIEDKKTLPVWAIILITTACIAIVAVIFILYKRREKTTGSEKSETTGSVEFPSSLKQIEIKYSVPTSDPLFRSLNN